MARRRESNAQEGSSVNPFVLVVDDNEDNVRIIEEMLNVRGFEVEVAMGGAAALAAIDRRRPDVVVLDVMMPEMDGMEVLDRIKANPQHAQIPVILVTAKVQDDDLLAGYKFGADYYITKPFTVRQLLYGIGLVLGREFPE
jgi:CheY-like chemotaxis protein